jgi:hypothetical protein
MKIAAAAFALFALFSAYPAQTAYFKYQMIEKEGFSFPVFSNRTEKAATGKINQLLQLAELNLLKVPETEDIFEKARSDNAGTIYGGKTDIETTIEHNSGKFLSIKLNETSSGMTCRYWVQYYTFNSGNGDYIQLKDLFTEKGYRAFHKFAMKRRIADFKKELLKLEPHQREYLLEIIGSYEADELRDFYIKGGSIYIDGENSFAKNDKFYGVETVSKFKLAEFKDYLNDYGRSLFSISKEPVGKFRGDPFFQLFQGTIAGQKVLLLLNKNDNEEIRAEYVYLRYGRGLFLAGELKEDQLTLTEKIPGLEENGYINAKFDGRQIVGTWTNKDRSAAHELRLTRK